MWIIKSIPAAAVNVLMDLAGQMIVAILMFSLGSAYPTLLWESVKRGGSISPNAVIAPPQSLLDALKWFLKDRTWLFASVGVLLAIGTISHPAADFFLDFVVVDVASNDTYFLGPSTGNLPTYELLGDLTSVTTRFPYESRSRLLVHVDTIAQGLSRLSILPPGPVLPDRTTLVPGSVERFQSRLAVDLTNITARRVPGDLQVQCESPEESIVAEAVIWPEKTPFREQQIPVCDYEAISLNKMKEEAPDSNGWQILDWTCFGKGPNFNASYPTSFPVGVRNLDGSLSGGAIEFSWNETALASTRGDNWQYGRRVRDGLSFVLGIRLNEDETDQVWEKDPEGVEFQVKYSVLTGPTSAGEDFYYTISSWSQNCPMVDSDGKLYVALSPEAEESSDSGCLIDTFMVCAKRFRQDDLSADPDTADESPYCEIIALSASLLRGIVVDPIMLAAYAGIATRNQGINDLQYITNHNFAVNSIAAAFVVTREIVPGAVGVEGVRASIGPAFLCCLLFPLVLAVSLFAVIKRSSPPPPVPRCVWDAIVLGRGEDTVPKRDGSDSTYPPCPPKMKYGIVADKSKDYDHLGLGNDQQMFIRLERPLSENFLKDHSSTVHLDTNDSDNNGSETDKQQESEKKGQLSDPPGFHPAAARRERRQRQLEEQQEWEADSDLIPGTSIVC